MTLLGNQISQVKYQKYDFFFVPSQIPISTLKKKPGLLMICVEQLFSPQNLELKMQKWKIYLLSGRLFTKCVKTMLFLPKFLTKNAESYM